jgi:hypothetical protein
MGKNTTSFLFMGGLIKKPNKFEQVCAENIKE